MKKLTLAGVSYKISDIEGMIFLIPSRLRQFERPIEMNLRKALALLKEKRWYEYVLMADMITVIATSPRNGDMAWVYRSREGTHHPAYFVDSGLVADEAVQWMTSLFVHESTHVFQGHYLSKEESADRRKREIDACREQIRFLKQLNGGQRLIKNISDQLKPPGGWWEYLDSGPTTKKECYGAERVEYFYDILSKLIPHISF